ncbi:MAG TPA: AAA family ATPase [Polyangium sp.]|nr:AAA family ATPase [Polyangium sp.]
MRLDRLIVGNYRSFATRRSIELRPITLLDGWNNAGKSNLVRLLAMLGDSVLETSPGPIDTSRVVDQGGGFKSLLSRYITLAEDPETLQLGLGWDDGFTGEFDLRLESSGQQRVDRIRCGTNDSDRIEFVAKRGTDFYVQESPSILTQQSPAEVVSRSNQGGNAGRARGGSAGRARGGIARRARGGAIDEVFLEFDGLVPRDARLVTLAERLRALRQTVQWLRAIRARPPRRFEPSGVRPPILSPDGGNAVDVLVADDDVHRQVAQWFVEVTQRELLLPEEGRERRVLLRPMMTAMDIDFVDTGEGMAQALPVLVAAAMSATSKGPRVLAIEEPESHLHPRAQSKLASFLCKIGASEEPPVMVLETHSFALLLGVQLAIASGEIPADRVALHWVDAARAQTESTIETIEFDSFGRPQRDGAIPVFATESELANELAAKQSEAW